MNIVDTHTHLYLKQFKDDIDDVIVRAKKIGVKKFVFPSIDSSHYESMHDLKNKYPKEIYFVFPFSNLNSIVSRDFSITYFACCT